MGNFMKGISHTQYLTLKEEWRVFGKSVRRRVGGVTGEWRALHKEELHDLYLQRVLLNDQMKEDVMGGKCSIHDSL
jgi:hypothetical protein